MCGEAPRPEAHWSSWIGTLCEEVAIFARCEEFSLKGEIEERMRRREQKEYLRSGLPVVRGEWQQAVHAG